MKVIKSISVTVTNFQSIKVKSRSQFNHIAMETLIHFFLRANKEKSSNTQLILSTSSTPSLQVHMHQVELEPTSSASTLFIQGEELPFELEIIGYKYQSITTKEVTKKGSNKEQGS